MGRLYPGERRNVHKIPLALRKMMKMNVKVTERRTARERRRNLVENWADLEGAYMRMVVSPEYGVSDARLKHYELGS